MDTVGIVFVGLCVAVFALGVAFLIEDGIQHVFGWGPYREPAEQRTAADRAEDEQAAQLVRDVEAMLRAAAGDRSPDN